MSRLSRGFTLIELVVVIVILAITAVFAAPRFLNSASDARKAALDGFVGAYQAADTMVVSKAMMHGMDYTLDYTQIPGTDLRVIYGHMSLLKEDLEKAMDISDFGVTSFDMTSTVIYMGKDLNKEELPLVEKGRCYVHISMPIHISDNNGVQTGTLLDYKVNKVYEGC
ncbi:type II secretion system protein [Photobacterium sp. BZF1]|uniref:pilus assembly FimT family protein n=1 Tax=Photobacterium sp. BZF1 TaxID=1904457 RepID=UPI001653D08F|nr:type II secretion system protein [Photobacterium sp. BZF1]MBC7002305.1 type II secretion system protein [Photobacterium sp. BZF1]